MVAVMTLTGGLCRLLGLLGPPVQALSPLPQDKLSSEEGLSEEDKTRRRAERRRAKRKRQRQRKKQEVAKPSLGAEQEEDGRSESDDSESEEEGLLGGEEEKTEEALTPLGSRRLQRSQEEEPAWDVSSAFFTNAARPRGQRPKEDERSKEDKENRRRKEDKENRRRKETADQEPAGETSTSLTEKGIQLVQQGLYLQAVSMFTEAIHCDPQDYRFLGNRSYCYSCLEQYPLALADAERCIQLKPRWAKGHFRRGSALIGMKRYSEAEESMAEVLALDEGCEEAANDLFHCKVLQLMARGLEESQSILLLEQLSTVEAVLSSFPDAARVGTQDPSLWQLSTAGPGSASLWVGNVTSELTEKRLHDLFKTFGEIESIRVLQEKFCAFVNFRNASMAARALDKLNGFSVDNTRLVVRYPDRRTQKVLSNPLKTTQKVLSTPLKTTQPPGTAAGPRRRGPINGDECYFWRTTGCHFGDKCRYKHLTDHKGQDRRPWQP